MKIIAKQIPPEYQSSPWQYVGWKSTMWVDLCICGNRHYHEHMTDTFRKIWNRFDEKQILRALHLCTGKKWDRTTIRGYSQGEWQDVYFPVGKYSPEDLRTLEIEYFNLGSEWEIIDENDPDESYCMYCYSDTPEAIRAEIANNEGVPPEAVTLYQFTGWSRTASHREV